MRDRMLVLETQDLRIVACAAGEAAGEAARRHRLASGSAAALGQAMAGALLLALHDSTRVDVQLECNGPLRGLLADAEPDGAVRGLVRAPGIEAPSGRFDARPVLASPHDERAGRLSILRAQPGSEQPQRAAFPFAGGDLGAALTFFLRNDREAGGELALEVLLDGGGTEVAGVLVAPLPDRDPELARVLGKPLRQGRLRDVLAAARELDDLAESLFGPARVVHQIAPRFACRCSRERLLRALRTVGPDELRDMAERDQGADVECDFCAAKYRISAAELLALL
jgi:molecular chaperone Hsp33